MFMWTIDKFLNPGHAAKVYEKFYYIAGMESVVMYTIGAIEMIVLLLFLAGYKKTYTYGAVLILHAVSTLSSFNQYLAPLRDQTYYSSQPGPCWLPVSHYFCCVIRTGC